MTDFNTPGVYDDVTLDSQELIDQLEQLNNAARELPGAVAESELVIASGSITPTGGVHTVDTEADAATDFLHFVNYANVRDGALLYLFGEAPGARVVTLESMQGGIGQLDLIRGESLDMKEHVGILLVRRGSLWKEIRRFGGPSLDLGDGGTFGTFSGLLYDKGAGNIGVWIEGVKVGTMAATYETV